MAQAPDIRVRLGVEGQREVSAAFQKLQTQAAATARAGTRTFDGLRTAAAAFARLLPAISLAAVIAGIVRMGRASVDSAAALDDMAEATGASVENLSQLEQQARISGTEIGLIEQAMQKLAKALSATDGEGKKAQRALHALGLDAAELRKLDTAEALRRIAVELVKYTDSQGKAALVQDLFGESGARLLPFLKDLATDQVRAANVTREQAAASEELGKQFRALQVDISNVAQRMALELVPGVVRYLQQLNEAIRITGSFGGALTFLFPTNPFNSTAENIAKVRRELDELRKTRARSLERTGTFSQSIDDDIKKAEQRLRFFRFVEAQEIETQRRARGADFGNTPGEARRFGLDEAGQQVLNYAASAATAGTQAQEAAGRFEDYQMRVQAAVAQAIHGSDVVRARELAAQIEALDRLFFESGLDAEIYESALRKLTGATDNLAEQARAAAEELRKQQALVDEGKAVYEATRTPAEQLAATLSNLQRLLDAGVLSWDTYARAVFAAQDDFDRLQGKTEETLGAMTEFAVQAARNIQSTMSDAFFNIGQGSLRELGFSFTQTIRRMLSDVLALQASTFLFGAEFGKTGKLGGLAGSFAKALGFARGGLVRAADGGHIRGPGGPTSDRIPAMLSPGEFVVRAAVVEQPGAREFLEVYNRFGEQVRRPIVQPVQAFADGGLVADASPATASPLDGRLTVGLEDGLVLRHMNTPEGQRLFVKMAGANKRAMRAALGI